MEFELQSQKLELESRSQAQTIQLAIAKMLSDILHAYKFSSICKCVTLYKYATH